MAELKKLAAVHDLQNELYYDGGVETILYLMGDTQNRKFICKSSGELFEMLTRAIRV